MSGITTRSPGLNALRLFAGRDELVEVEGEDAGAAELACRTGLRDGADEGGALRDGDGVVGVENGLGNDRMDTLPAG